MFGNNERRANFAFDLGEALKQDVQFRNSRVVSMHEH